MKILCVLILFADGPSPEGRMFRWMLRASRNVHMKSMKTEIRRSLLLKMRRGDPPLGVISMLGIMWKPLSVPSLFGRDMIISNAFAF